MQRRHFLKSLAGTGALIATAQLPSWGEDRPEVFPERGTWERLSLSYAVVKIGLERPFSVLHLTDSHLAPIRYRRRLPLPRPGSDFPVRT